LVNRRGIALDQGCSVSQAFHGAEDPCGWLGNPLIARSVPDGIEVRLIFGPSDVSGARRGSLGVFDGVYSDRGSATQEGTTPKPKPYEEGLLGQDRPRPRA